MEITSEHAKQIDYWMEERKLLWRDGELKFCPVINGRCRKDCICFMFPIYTIANGGSYSRAGIPAMTHEHSCYYKELFTGQAE